jgi:hypothetical protein
MTAQEETKMNKGQVTRGAKRLTEHFGDDSWKGKIRVDELDMCSTNQCVLGQLFGSFGNGADALLGEDRGYEDAIYYGFEVMNPRYYDELTEAWRKYLA